MTKNHIVSVYILKNILILLGICVYLLLSHDYQLPLYLTAQNFQRFSSLPHHRKSVLFFGTPLCGIHVWSPERTKVAIYLFKINYITVQFMIDVLWGTIFDWKWNYRTAEGVTTMNMNTNSIYIKNL